MYRREQDTTLAMPACRHVPAGSIPQVERTWGYLNTAYPCTNEKQLAIGDSGSNPV